MERAGKFGGGARYGERRATARALSRWSELAVSGRVTRERMAAALGTGSELIGANPIGDGESMRRRIAELAPVALALGTPIEFEGWAHDRYGRPTLWRVALLPLTGADEVLAVTGSSAWLAPSAFT